MKEGDLIAGRYRLERRAGSGGMGTVFRAFDNEHRKSVAVKTLSDQPIGDSSQSSGARLIARFEREASALAAVAVTGIVRYVAHGISESNEPYLVMQWVEGQDLASRLNDRGLSSNDTLRLGARLAEALASLHAHGIVHRDLKPANVMLEHGEVERAVLVDLGVARRAGFASATLTGARVGTPSYMAPEQIRDPRTVDGRADVFSLGCILFECLSGRRAFDAEDGLGAIAKILLERAPSLTSFRPDLPPAIPDIVARMLERNPSERPHADAALCAALSVLATHAEVDSPPPRLALPAKVVTRTEVFGTRAELADSNARGRADSAYSAGLPYRKGPLVGREREISELVGFVSTGARCVWLWGAPGIGKTRLALELCGQRSLEAVPKVAAFVELATVQKSDDLLRVLAQRLGARLRGAEGAPEALARALAARGPLTLVLDGVDLVSQALEPLLECFLSLAPETRFIVTSRERPHLRSAFALEIGPLPVRADRELLTAPLSEASPAAQLFVQGLREHGHPPPQSPEERLDVERIARALDGVPLALELLAARVPVLGLGRVAAEVTLPYAQRESTLGDAETAIASQVRMSFETLTPAEQRTLLGCAVFAGRFGAGALQAVLAQDLPAATVLEALQHLREKSLLSATGSDFALLAPVRDFALTELTRDGHDAELVARHRDYQSRRVRELLRLREAEGARKTLSRLEHDVDDVLAAVDYSLAAPTVGSDFVLAALVALEPLISARGPLPAFMSVLNRGIAAAEANRVEQSPELLARVLALRGRLLTTTGSFALARQDLLRARDIAQARGVSELEGSILLEIGVNHHFQRELGAARDCYERALELCVGTRQDSVRGRCYGNLGAVLHDQGRLTEAAAHYWKGIRTLEESGEARELGNFLSNLAVLEQELGARADARRHYQQALAHLEDLAEARLHAIALGNLGVLESEEGAWDAARKCHQRALELLRTQHDPFSEALCRARLGAALAMLEREEEADEELSRARRMIADADAPRIAAVRLHRAFLDLARARRALDAGARSESERRLSLAEDACLEIANEQHDGVKLKALSDDVRATLRVLGPMLRSTRQRIAASTDPPSTTLVGDR